MTMTLEQVRDWLEPRYKNQPDDVYDAIDAAIRERDRLRGDVAGMTEELLHVPSRDDWRELQQRAERAEAELVALKERIAEAPVVACPKTLVYAGNTMQTEFLEYTHERMPGGCNSWAGKRVRLVVEE